MASKRSKHRNFPAGDTKRSRARNFSPEEKEVLLERVLKRIEIVENKKTDSITAKAKERAWQQIMNEYNSRVSSPRSAAALHTCWRNMKRKSRRISAEENKNIFKTSDGQYFDIQSERIHNKVRDILSCSLDELQKPYGLDTPLCNKDVESGNTSLETDQEVLSDCEDLQEDTVEQATPIKTPSMLRNPVEKRKTLYESSKTSPYVHTLSSSGMTEEQVHEDSKTIPIIHHRQDFSSLNSNNRSGVRGTSYRQSEPVENLSDALTESKLELAKLAMEHAISEEKRSVELHELRLQEAKLKIEILKLELAKKQSDLINNQ